MDSEKTAWSGKVILRSILLSCILGFPLGSCSIFGPSGAGLARLNVDELGNGYLIRIVAENRVGEATAFVGPSNWLIITIADSTLQLDQLESLHSPLVDSVEVNSFATAVQISLRLTRQVDKVEIIRQKPINEILISLFLRRED